MELNIGILMAGSLYWDEGRRKVWRDARLLPETACAVTAPIRYGRKSSRRGNTYTMVFSRGCPLGEAKVVTCRSQITSADDLMVEAEQLWKAERLSDRANHQVSAPWGCVALLVRPSAQVPPNLLRSWAKRTSSESNYGSVPQTEGEGTLVGDDGILRIAWPEPAGGESQTPLKLDLLLATVTHPTLDDNKYPSAQAIASAWGEADPDEVLYFRSNRRHSIRTFQDEEILAELREAHPRQYAIATE
jgi:hypothetical protein